MKLQDVKREILFQEELPDVCIDVRKSKGQPPIMFVYEPNYDDEGEMDLVNVASTDISNREYKRWKKGSVLERLQIAVKAMKDLIELDEMHRGLQ